MHIFLFAVPALLPLILAQGPNDPDFYNTVAEIYSGPACDAASFVWADPIFGRGGTCQLLDRNDNTPDIISYKVTAQYPGCSATLYTDDGCLSTAYPAPVGVCVEAADEKPFVKAFVECPFS
ncbi:hypothetical protein P171DRAFT_427627 [Karstenula rhodostoma CBS 690.94]|uniref:Uncharacterized protein n=1 Tax=Karstenula rhodostoma CBS 690.94 TaxID=1392251 RepID=A0A9P4PSG5_9PLEO|nr:hypothetical protein P171DRAFT_427627 [Karstenula rhodostoma CBS 690.94]